MKKQNIVLILLMAIIGLVLFSCDQITIFHGQKPEVPPVTYTVIFDANGATDGTAPLSQTVNSGTVISLPNRGSLVKSGFDFVGWSEDSEGTPLDAGSNFSVTKDIIFYARWFDPATPKYTVTFHANGASGIPPSSKTVYSGLITTLPSRNTLSFTNKNFVGWNTLANGQGTNYIAGERLTVTEDLDLYAQWLSIVTYTVTFDPNGASGTPPSPRTEDPGTVFELPDQGSMTNSGKVFKGWNTLANGSGTLYVAGGSYTVNGNATLYAQWALKTIRKHTETFNNSTEWSLPDNVQYPAEIEIYALGAGGGGQGGHEYAEWGNHYGTGGAGGGGAVTYAKFDVSNSIDFTITVGSGGSGGEGTGGWLLGFNEAGDSGRPGGTTTVEWDANLISVAGGNGGNSGKDLLGGTGGKISDIPSIIATGNWSSVKGENGGDGVEDGNAGNKGGISGKLTYVGSLPSFGGDSLGKGKGGAGGYENTYGSNGADGQVVIVVSWYE